MNKKDEIQDSLGNLGEGEKGAGKTEKVSKTPNPTNTTDDLVKELIKRLDEQKAEINALKSQKPEGKEVDMSVMIAKIVNQIKAGENGGEYNPYKYFTPEELEPEDVLPEPTIFYAYSTGYVITDDLRNGKSVKTPYGNTIFFNFQATQQVKSRNGIDLQSYCTYPSYSKKEVAWLKQHRFFGMHFFETIKEAIETNSEIASKITKHFSSLSALTPEKIINIYKSNFPEGTIKDVDKMKNALAMAAVKKEILSDADAQSSFFNDVFKTNYETKQKIIA